MNKNYEVQKMSFDATRPYAVIATFRSFNRVVGRYETEAKAKRAALDLNRTSTQWQVLCQMRDFDFSN